MKSLYYLPLGGSMRESFLQAASQNAYGEHLVLVPGRFIRSRMSRNNQVQVVGIDYLPNEILRLAGYASTSARLTRQAQELLVRQILTRFVEKKALPYFQVLATKDGFVQNIVNLLDELISNNITVEELTGAFSAWGREKELQEKDKEILAIYTAYCSLLEQDALYDMAGLYKLALGCLEKGSVKLPWKKLYLTDFYKLNPLQLELLLQVGKQCDLAIGLVQDEAPATACTKSLCETLVGAGFSVETPPAAVLNAVKVQPAISVVETATQTEELNCLLKDIKAKVRQGVSYSDILCVVRNMDYCVGWEKAFAEAGVPCQLPATTRLALHPLCQLVALLLQAAQKLELAELWQELLNNSLLGRLYGFSPLEITALRQRRYFTTRAQIWAEISYAEQLTPLWEKLKKLEKAKSATEITQVLLQLLEDWKLLDYYGQEYKQGRITLEEMKSVALAVTQLKDCFEQVRISFAQAVIDKKQENLGSYTRMWEQVCSDQSLVLSKGNPQGIQLVEAANVQGIQVPFVYVVGLREEQYPLRHFENWIYTDKERKELKELGVTLPLLGESILDDEFFFGNLLATATTELHLSYFVDDSCGCSSYLKKVYQRYPQAQAAGVSKWQGQLENCVAAQALALELLEHSTLGAEEAKLVEKEFGTAWRAKAELDLTRFVADSPYNGKVTQGDARASFSASALNTYITCPFNYLLNNYLGLRPWQLLEGETRPEVEGSLYHAVLKRFLEQHLQTQLKEADKESLEQELDKILQIVEEEMRTEGLLAKTLYAPFETVRRQKLLQQWLSKEIDYQKQLQASYLPCAVEVGFGGEGNKVTSSFEVGGTTLEYRGSIDRLDAKKAADGSTSYIITDYKTSSYPADGNVREGKDVQLAIYARAVQELYKATAEQLAGAGYFRLRKAERKGGCWQEQGLPWLEKVKKLVPLTDALTAATSQIQASVAGMRAGEFEVRNGTQCPMSCPYADICRYKLLVPETEEEQDA